MVRSMIAQQSFGVNVVHALFSVNHLEVIEIRSFDVLEMSRCVPVDLKAEH